MCDPVTIALTSLQVMTPMQEHKSAKAVAHAKQRTKEQTRRKAGQA